MGQAYRPFNNDCDSNQRGGGGFGNQSYVDRAQQQIRMEEAESLDVNAGIHGNWTIENAKAKLHQFMQVNKIQADYKYTPVGPDHARYFVEVSFSSIFIVYAGAIAGLTMLSGKQDLKLENSLGEFIQRNLLKCPEVSDLSQYS